MTIVSNDPIWWPVISYFRVYSYFSVASFTVVLYDWVLTFGREFELVWRQPWSLMTVLYFIVRYTGIPFIIVQFLIELPSTSLTDTGCGIIGLVWGWMPLAINFMLGAIVIIRLHAMYQRSRKMLIFLSGTFLTVQIACMILGVVDSMRPLGVAYVLSGTHVCAYYLGSGDLSLLEPIWILITAWEILALCLAFRITVKHFRELQRPLTTWPVGDCFTVLIETHVFYFASFVVVSFLQLISFSPKILSLDSVESEMFLGFLSVVQVVQMFVLGPRLILGVREYHAKLVADSDEATGVASIVFQDRIHIETGGGV